ncbi:MAG: hypothetical protein KF773_13545 [Deltaproteobacteria bacterium]|nr:hypothetical protein [Deltaproteobacteria bacterium]
MTITGASPRLVPGLAVLAGTHDDRARTARFLDGAVDALAMRGYPRARVEVTRTTGCFVDLAVRVELGTRYTIGRIEFQTDDDFPARERLAAIEDGLGTVNVVGGVYIDYRLERGLAALERRYRDAGWLEVEIDRPQALFRGGEVELVVPIHAGARFRVAKVRARGDDAAARKAILAELRDRAGAWYDGPAIRSAIARARRKVDREIALRTTTTDDGEVVLEAVMP